MQVSVVLAFCFSILLDSSLATPLTTFGRPPTTTPKSNEENVEAFFEAVESDNIEAARRLITPEIVNAVDAEGTSALHWVAAENGDAVIAKLLIENGASVNHKDNNNESAIQTAAKNGNLKIVELLVEHGAEDVDAALNLAKENGHKDITDFLRQKQQDNQMALFDAVLNDKVEDVRKCIKTQDINGLNKDGKSALHLASMNGNIKIVKLLIKKGATIDILDNDNTTPLLRAVEKNKMKIAELLLKNGANVDAKDKHGITALMRAGEHGHEEMAKLLLAHNASVDIMDNYSTNAAGWARSRGNYNVANIIQNAQLYRVNKDDSDDSDDSDSDSDSVETSSTTESEDIKVDDVNKRDEHLRTPLHLAVLKEDVDLVKKLLENNADVNLVDDVGSNPLHRAAENGNEKIAEILIKHGVDMDHKDTYGCTPLHRAAEHDTVAVAELLIKNGASMSITDNYGDIPLGWTYRGSTNVRDLLIKNGSKRYR